MNRVVFVIKIGLSPLRVATFEHFFDFGALICVRFEHPFGHLFVFEAIFEPLLFRILSKNRFAKLLRCLDSRVMERHVGLSFGKSV